MSRDGAGTGGKSRGTIGTSLPVRRREVIALRILLDLNVDTTADTLGIAPGTVKAHLHRAIATLRTRLAPLPEKTAV
jgi:DNA-directed RNA polymerase specialized sigma24 family protein